VDAGDNFGASVAIDGSTVIVGAPGYGPLEEGGAFLFERSAPPVGRGGGPQWLERATLQPPNPDAGSLFGASVALQDGLALVGAPDEDVGTAENAGIVHLFEGQGSIWEWIMRLASPAPEFQGQFGTALALDGARIVVGAPNEGPTPTRGLEGPGAAHLFVRAGGSWIFRTSFERDAQAPGIFGDAVAVSGQHAAVGDPWYNLPTRGCCSDQGQTAFFTVSDECLDPLAVNVTKSLIYPQLPPALDEASPFDFLEATDPAFRDVPSIATGGVPLFLESTGAIRTPFGTSISLSASSLLATAPGHDASFYGPVSVGAGASVIAGSTLTNAQSLSLLGGTLAPLAGVSNPGAIIGFGQIDASVRNPGSVTVQADLVVTGDYANAGLPTIQSGTLTVLGELTNTGSIVGDAESTRGESAGLFADAGLVSGAGAILMLPNGSTLTVGGDADCAIDDNDRFDLATSTVRMAGVGGTQRMESMSADIGADPAGLDRTMNGHYPLGALRVGPTPTTVSIVDAHDNDGAGQGGCEAVYVGQLRIDAGATLLTGGCRVYYQSLVLNGDVDDPGNLVQISASCGVADLAEPLGELNFSDVFAFLVAFGSMGPAADLAAPFGVFDFSDVFAFLVAFGAGCP